MSFVLEETFRFFCYVNGYIIVLKTAEYYLVHEHVFSVTTKSVLIGLRLT